MKTLVPRALRFKPDVDATSEFPDDVARLVSLAAGAGYTVSPEHAAELWWRYSAGVCGRWSSPAEHHDASALQRLLDEADIIDGRANALPPPEGYPTWLDYAVETVDTGAEQTPRLLVADTQASRREALDAARAELAMLRRLAGNVNEGS